VTEMKRAIKRVMFNRYGMTGGEEMGEANIEV